jgi:methyltransferase (TIGR00027 family)
VRASRTAVLVCQGRAVAQGRMAVGRFDDPTAMAFLRDAERATVERARTGVPRPNRQLVVPGAGLDRRARRMGELASVAVFEVDQPASQRHKSDRARELRPLARSLRFVPVDLSQVQLGPALASAGHRESLATTWIWEGVVPYLSKPEVGATLQVVSGRSAPGSLLIVNYQAPDVSATLGRLAARALTVMARRPDPLASEPRRSTWTPTAMRQLPEAHSWVVHRDDDLRAGRIVVADR